jgi:prophage antirepressor-like protein
MPVSNTPKPGGLLPDLLSPMTVMNLRALQLQTALQDGEWHLATDIAKMLGLNAEYVRQILRSHKDDWGLESRRMKGYRLVPCEN